MSSAVTITSNSGRSPVAFSTASISGRDAPDAIATGTRAAISRTAAAAPGCTGERSATAARYSSIRRATEPLRRLRLAAPAEPCQHAVDDLGIGVAANSSK